MSKKTIIYIVLVIVLVVLSGFIGYVEGKQYMNDYCVDPYTANNLVDLTNEMINEVNDCKNSNIKTIPNFNE